MATVIYTIRNRDIERLINSINSLRKQSKIEFSVHIVDYGCKVPVSEQMKSHLNSDIRITRTETQGLPWCKSIALNIGAKMANTKYIATIDIDMLFEGDILKYSSDICDINTKIHCSCWWLPKSGNKAKAVFGGYGQLGGYQFMHKELYDKYGGFDERIVFWGIEDVDWHMRLTKAKVKTIWIDDKIKMYHVWHPLSYGWFDTRPIYSMFDSDKIYMMNYLSDITKVNNNTPILSRQDRPILDLIDKKSPCIIKINESIGENNFFSKLDEILNAISREKFVKIEFGKRHIFKNQWKRNIKYIEYFNRKIVKYGLKIDMIKNTNFDYFYSILPTLQNNGLKDYYLLDDYSAVYCIF